MAEKIARPILTYADEVHHAVSDEIKLRAVVTKWAQNNTVNSVIGFSGTPYLDKVEKIKVVDLLSIGTAEITNIVYYYPLIDGVGNFLKRPVVKIADIADSSLIIEKGVREFLDNYKDTVYADGLTAKFLNSSAKKPYKPIEISEDGLELIEFLSVDCNTVEGEWHSDSEIKIDKNGYVIADGVKTKAFWDGCIRSTKKPLRLKIRNICGDETVWEV